MEMESSLKGSEYMDYKIVPDRQHLKVYIEGKFYCTVDNWKEADEEIQNYYAERR